MHLLLNLMTTRAGRDFTEVQKMYDEVWAVDAERIREFFRDHRDEVEVTALPEKRVGSMLLPQTRIVITGDDADELYHRFYLSFMTAGG